VAYSAASYSSDYEFGYTNNAAAGGNSWGMSSSLFSVPTVQGVDINGVIYQYTAIKDRSDPYTVSIQNENADGNGYIFRSTDDWSGKSGQTITKLVPIPYSPLEQWGDGSIETVGIGTVENPVVVYTFRKSPVNPEITLPEIPQITLYDPFSDQAVLIATQETDLDLLEREQSSEKEKDDEDDGQDLEKALSSSEHALSIADGVSQSQLLLSMNIATNLNNYYTKQLVGGIYKEPVVLQDKKITDNARVFRSLGQDKLHKSMVGQQYGR